MEALAVIFVLCVINAYFVVTGKSKTVRWVLASVGMCMVGLAILIAVKCRN